MRTLTKEQKAILSKWANYNKDLLGIGNPVQALIDSDIEVYEQLVKINDTEILWTEVNRFLSDFVSEKLYG